MKIMSYYKFDEYCREHLSPTVERVYKALLSYKNRNEACAYPRQEKLAEKCRLSVRTIIRAIKVLVEKGFIIIHKFKHVIGHYNKYELLIIPEVIKQEVKTNNASNNNSKQSSLEDLDSTFDDEFNNNLDKNVNYIEKVKLNTRIKKISPKQEKDINDFGAVVINQTIAKIKAKKVCNPKYASKFIDLLVETALQRNCLKEFQRRKFDVKTLNLK